MTFTVDLYNRSFASFSPHALTVKPARYSSKAIGGCAEAELVVEGDPTALWDTLDWLRFWVVIRNEHRTPVWWGIVVQAQVNLGAVGVGVDLEEVRNRIKVAYTESQADGSQLRKTTAWAEDSESQAKYGVHEEYVSYGDISTAEANARRDTLLSMRRWPVRTVEVAEGDLSASLRCVGLWETLAWKRYGNPIGYEAHDVEGGDEQLLGWVLSSDLIAFTPHSRIHHQGWPLMALQELDKIVVSGSVSNNGVYTVADPIDDNPTVYTANTIYIESNDDILDTAGGLGFIKVDDVFEIEGTVSNNGWYWADGNTGRHITVNGWGASPTVNEGDQYTGITGATIKRSLNVRVTEQTLSEVPGNTITLTAWGQKIAQSFTPTAGTGTWPVNEVAIRLRALYGPTDGVQVQLCADSAGSPGTVLATSTAVSGANCSTVMAWHTFTFPSPANVTAGTTYWLVVSRTGSVSHQNYYKVALDENFGYAGGAMKLYTGSAWVTRTPDADMPFRVYSASSTGAQIQAMITAAGQWFAGLDVQNVSSVTSKTYRYGDQTAKEEAEALMASGPSGGTRYLSKVTPERFVVLYSEPVSGGLDWMLDANGRVLLPTGLPVEEGVLPTARWLKLEMIPAGSAAVTSVGPVFVERAEFDAELGKVSAIELRSVAPWETWA
jgi:hypothetical protein